MIPCRGGKDMAVIDDLLQKVQDPVLRDRLAREIHKATKHKKFGLVFEEHLPECTPLYDVPVKKGSKVALRTGKVNDFYTVSELSGGIASCYTKDRSDVVDIPVDDLVCVAEFGEPIYPYLKPIDTVCNAPDSDLWHTLIEADNYHALQILEYLYAGKVDCIYIDPPYNTGARDWKYNNDYVDSNDQYRHSKWLSFMERRLKLAKHLLNPRDSVLIVTIDEKEYLHLGCLLEEIFPGANMQMISSVINPKGSSRKNLFSRSNEFIYFILMGDAAVQALPLSDEWRTNAKDKRLIQLRWADLMRFGDNGTRARAPKCFYPILVSEDGKKFMGVGNPLPLDGKKEDYVPPKGTIAIWPIHSDGAEGCWGYSTESLLKIQQKGYVKLGKLNNGKMRITYLSSGTQKKVEDGLYEISGYNEDGSIISDTEVRNITAMTQWNITSHNSHTNGTVLLQEIIGKRFTFPKSLYAVHDAVRFFVGNNPNALIVDFFAGSGTTLHAVNLLNAEDGGHRRCIMVTNNEVSDAEAKALTKQGYKPGDDEWEKLGVARYVTWPRTVCSIKGHDVNGKPLKGKYLGSDAPMSDGFKTNAAYFKLGFLDRNAVALGRQFKELLPVLWMKAGCVGPCPQARGDADIPDMMILPQNKMAVLVDEASFALFEEEIQGHPEIETVYIVTDSERGYKDMAHSLNVRNTYQLYRSYLDNFKINHRR